MGAVKLSELSNVASLELEDLLLISQYSAGNYNSASIRYQELITSLYGSYTITVNGSGTGDYSTIEDGLAAAGDIASATTSVVDAVIPEFASTISIFLGDCRKSIVFLPVLRFLTNQIKPP